MSRKLLTGSFVALITPFNKDGSVDFAAFRTLLKFQEDRGTSAVLIMGSTGETSMLSPEEKKKIIVETAKMKTPRMNSDLHWEHLLRLFKHPNYVVHKESTAQVGQVAQVLAGKPKVSVMCCDSPNLGLVVPTMSLGGHGTA